MSKSSIAVGLKAEAGSEDELRGGLLLLVEPSCNEDGNIRFDLFGDQDGPGRFVASRAWIAHPAFSRQWREQRRTD